MSECVHPEEDRSIEDREVDTMTNGEHDTYTVKVYVCDRCGEDLDGDPEVDAAEDAADAAADNWRDE